MPEYFRPSRREWKSDGNAWYRSGSKVSKYLERSCDSVSVEWGENQTTGISSERNTPNKELATWIPFSTFETNTFHPSPLETSSACLRLCGLLQR